MKLPLILNKNSWQVIARLDALKRLLQDFLSLRAILPPSSKTAQLCVNKKILKNKPARILNSRNLFVLDLHQEDQSRAKAGAREALCSLLIIHPCDSVCSYQIGMTNYSVIFIPQPEIPASVPNPLPAPTPPSPVLLQLIPTAVPQPLPAPTPQPVPAPIPQPIPDPV